MLTLADVAPGNPPGRWEIIDGVLQKRAFASGRHNRISERLRSLLGPTVNAPRCSLVAADTGFVLRESPLLLRVPDVALLLSDRLPASYDDGGFVPIAPDLAIEVLDQTDIWSEVVVKTDHWLAHGTQQVWVVDPVTDSITVFQAADAQMTIHAGDVLTGGDLLPEFAVEVGRVFARRG